MYQCPGTKESDIPHRTKLHDEIMQKAEEVMDLMKNHFKVSGSWLCNIQLLTYLVDDTWENVNNL
jgi:hypothetical protein